jgi:hypothetical protein
MAIPKKHGTGWGRKASNFQVLLDGRRAPPTQQRLAHEKHGIQIRLNFLNR